MVNNVGFSWGMPPLVLYGAGCVSRVGDAMKQLGGKRALLVTDCVLLKSGQADEIRALLRQSGVGLEIYSSVDREPEDVHVEEGLKMFKESSCDSIIALGGGSCIDAAKGIGVMATNPGKLADYEARQSEGQKGADGCHCDHCRNGQRDIAFCCHHGHQQNRQDDIKDEKLRPNVAVCDPLLTVSMPPSVTASSGMDALIHAMRDSIEGMSAYDRNGCPSGRGVD